MSQLVSLFKNSRIGQMLTVLIVGVALFLTTACNPGTVQSARPDNPPVQAGGNNTPPTMGGDSYTNYKMSTDPSVNDKAGTTRSKVRNPEDRQPKRATLPLTNDPLVASSNIESKASDLLYPGSGATNTDRSNIGTRGLSTEPEPLPAVRQRIVDRSDPNEKILERVGQQFEDASEFLQDTGDAAAQRPELQRNPAVGK